MGWQAVSEDQNEGNVMERLTYRDKDGFPMMKKRGGFKQGGIERLAAYEDTRLEPEKIYMDHEAAEQLRQLCQGCDLDRLEELAEADKDGRLAVLPVRPVLTQSIGSMLYIIEDGEIVEDSLCEALVGMGNNGEINIFYTTLSDQISFEQADIGQSVFLTREEAEKALEKKKNEY